MSGISTFNGIGYDVPNTSNTVPTIKSESATATSAPRAASSGPGYTMPVDPNVSSMTTAYYNADPISNPQLGTPDWSADVRHAIGRTTGNSPPLIMEVAAESPSPAMSLLNPASSNAVSTVPDPVILPAELSASDQIVNSTALNSGAESLPLESEVIRWYQYPIKWMKGWNSHAELGLDGSSGNAETLAIQTGLELKRKTDKFTYAIDFDYRQASNRTSTTEDNGRLNIDFDRLLGDTPWSLFGKFGLEWDKFKAFDLRVNMNAGLGYHWIRNDDTTLVTRFGAGASKEIGAPDDAWSPEAVFGIDGEHQINKRQKLKGKIDYFPAWNDFADFRFVADVAWEVLLDDSENLSLKISATDRYDSTPQGARPNDTYYSLLLLYKF